MVMNLDYTDIAFADADLPMRHLQIVNVARYARDFQIHNNTVVFLQSVVFNSIRYFLGQLNTGTGVSGPPLNATNIPMLAYIVWNLELVNPDPYPFSRAVRVSEDVYQRIRKLTTNETSPDFNLMSADECGNPYTYVTKLDDYQQTFRVTFATVLRVNSWLREIDTILSNNPAAMLDLPVVRGICLNVPRVATAKAPVCAEINHLRSVQFYEDLYCRWRNIIFGCKNLVRDGAAMKPETVMALYYASLDKAREDAAKCKPNIPLCG